MHLNEIEQLIKAHEKQVSELENQISKLQVSCCHTAACLYITEMLV